jgi:RNA polymerase sigma factor (sigma-70 family)
MDELVMLKPFSITSKAVSPEYIKRTGTRAGFLCGLQYVDADACGVDFAAHFYQQRSMERWAAAGYSPAWLNACARNFARDYARSTGAYLKRVLIDTDVAAEFILDRGRQGSDPQSFAMQAETRRAIARALSRLNPRQRTAVKLKFSRGFDSAEIATALGTTPTAAEKLIYRALASLKGRLMRAGFGSETALHN